MIEIKKDITLYITLGVLAVLLVVFVFILREALSSKSDAESELQQKIAENKTLFRDASVPSVITVSALKKEENRIRAQKNSIYNLLIDADTKEDEDMEYPSPVEFKDKLLSYQTRLVNRADANGVKLPGTLGFEEYEGGDLPSMKDIPLLIRQMKIIEKLVNLFIDSRVQLVEKIEREETKISECRHIDGICTVLNFSLEMTCQTPALIKFMGGLEFLNSFIIIKNMGIEADKINKVKMFIKAVDFRKENENS
ncbi:MAG: Amuc_1100 family pilus-like protein [Candidatus Aureabacteria bacterium]|nr:Amuc_1100 family pilus-like protein [Candidatus Auribacterota bacterium]MCK5161003.1 Amuc_1100 family pilus-like protein [Candidatus Auribacterota bacterium]